MQGTTDDLNLVLISENPMSASMLRDAMQKSGIHGLIRRLSPGTAAVNCARQSGAYANKQLPDLILFDYSVPDEYNTEILKKVAFSQDRARVPVVLLTSPASQDLLDKGDVDEHKAVMFSPTSLASFVRKLAADNRASFFRALDTLYQYGPILVRMPIAYLGFDQHNLAMTA